VLEVAEVVVAASGGVLPFDAWMMSPIAAYGSCEMRVRVHSAH
jgi:hypothetical protein